MKQPNSLIKLLYGYIGFAFFMVFLNIIGVFRPLPDILAALSLLIAGYYIGRYTNLPKKKF